MTQSFIHRYRRLASTRDSYEAFLDDHNERWPHLSGVQDLRLALALLNARLAAMGHAENARLALSEELRKVSPNLVVAILTEDYPDTERALYWSPDGRGRHFLCTATTVFQLARIAIAANLVVDASLAEEEIES